MRRTAINISIIFALQHSKVLSLQFNDILLCKLSARLVKKSEERKNLWAQLFSQQLLSPTFFFSINFYWGYLLFKFFLLECTLEEKSLTNPWFWMTSNSQLLVHSFVSCGWMKKTFWHDFLSTSPFQWVSRISSRFFLLVFLFNSHATLLFWFPATCKRIISLFNSIKLFYTSTQCRTDNVTVYRPKLYEQLQTVHVHNTK